MLNNETEQRHRRIAGAILGALIGFAYGAVSQFINPYVLPGIPFYQPPFGPYGNAAMFTVLGAVVGLLTVWPESGLVSISAVSLALSVALIGLSLPGAKVEPKAVGGFVVGLIFMLIPFFGMFFVPLAILRWVVVKEELARRDQEPVWVQARLPLLLLLVAGGVGATSLLPADGRVVMTRMNALLQDGQQAADSAALPRPLQPERVADFRQNGARPYQLEWTFSNLQRYEIPYGLNQGGYPSAAIGHFDGGWTLVCLYPTPQAEPSCKPYTGGASTTQGFQLPSLIPLDWMPR